VNKKRIDEIERLLKVAEDDLSNLEKQHVFLLSQIALLKREKENISTSTIAEHPSSYIPAADSSQLSGQEKIILFRSLFRGREDVYPRRFESLKTGKSGYQPDCANEWMQGVCDKPKIKCTQCKNRKLIPVSDEIIKSHLRGHNYGESSGRDFTVGVYPMLPDETCWFLAVDFDKSTWRADAIAYWESCKSYGIPANLERSRSGNGGHIWIFFSEPISARLARRLGSFLLTKTIEKRPEIGLESYDRFFPNQDTLPQGGFGNLIALPLQRKPREKGSSVFVDEDLEPYPDQWSYLASIKRLAPFEVGNLLQKFSLKEQELGSSSTFASISEEVPWEEPRFEKWRSSNVQGPFPTNLILTLANQVYIPKQGLSPSLRNRIIRTAAFPNPEFYRAQAMRQSIFGKPRIICCIEDFSEYLALPRGCLDELSTLFKGLGIEVEIVDRRWAGTTLDLQFQGTLSELQQQSAQALIKHETGVLVAPTAFGKTVIAAWLIAKRKTNTIVLVHNRQLMDQWNSRLKSFLDLPVDLPGQIGGGKKKASGKVDVAMLQSLFHDGEADPIIEQYGQLIVDECHHISARSFEQVARAAKARFITGFSATVERKDGHHPIIFMQCGPIRHHVQQEDQRTVNPMDQIVITRLTGFMLPDNLAQLKSLNIHDIYDSLIQNQARNRLIIDDALNCLAEGRSPLLLTERKEHLEILRKALSHHVPNLIILKGGMGRKDRKEALESLKAEVPRLVLATGRFLGEGFDDSRLDTLLLAMPISWKGTLAQYAGRLQRVHSGKMLVVVYDYADLNIPMLKRMYQRRLHSYRLLGYEIRQTIDAND
jgi:superfamily II DNA or RNA helicase